MQPSRQLPVALLGTGFRGSEADTISRIPQGVKTAWLAVKRHGASEGTDRRRVVLSLARGVRRLASARSERAADPVSAFGTRPPADGSGSLKSRVGRGHAPWSSGQPSTEPFETLAEGGTAHGGCLGTTVRAGQLNHKREFRSLRHPDNAAQLDPGVQGPVGTSIGVGSLKILKAAGLAPQNDPTAPFTALDARPHLPGVNLVGGSRGLYLADQKGMERLFVTRRAVIDAGRAVKLALEANVLAPPSIIGRHFELPFLSESRCGFGMGSS